MRVHNTHCASRTPKHSFTYNLRRKLTGTERVQSDRKTSERSCAKLTALLHDVNLALQLGQLRLHFDVQALHGQQEIRLFVDRRVHGTKVSARRVHRCDAFERRRVSHRKNARGRACTAPFSSSHVVHTHFATHDNVFVRSSIVACKRIANASGSQRHRCTKKHSNTVSCVTTFDLG